MTKKKIFTFLLAVLLCFFVCGCSLLITKNESNPSASVSEPEHEPILTDESITCLEEMLNEGYFLLGQTEDFSKLSPVEIIEQYILTGESANGLYHYFGKDNPNICIDDIFDQKCSDPKKLFDVTYELDAKTTDWIIKNVFNVEPTKEIVSDSTYYHKDKVYRLACKFGGGSLSISKLESYKYLGEGKYELFVCDYDADQDGEYNIYGSCCKIIAEPKTDETYGNYWKFYSSQPLYDVIPTSDTPWKQAYIDYLTKETLNPDYSYHLLDIDGDKIPELFINTHSYANGKDLLFYKNDKLLTLHTSGEFDYIPNKNLICDSGGHSDHYFVKVFEIKDDSITQIGGGEHSVYYNDISDPTIEYIWEGKKVSEKNYNDNLTALFDPSGAVNPRDSKEYNSNVILHFIYYYE